MTELYFRLYFKEEERFIFQLTPGQVILVLSDDSSFSQDGYDREYNIADVPGKKGLYIFNNIGFQAESRLKDISGYISQFGFSFSDELIRSSIKAVKSGHIYDTVLYRNTNVTSDDESEQIETYLAVLGLSSGSTLDDVKKAYRELSLKFHPDTIAGKDLDPAFIEFANNKFSEIQEAYDFLKDEKLLYQPIMSAMAEIEGYASISIASDLLSNNHGGKGILLGGVAGVSPTEVVIIGAGNAGTNAARAALALGASVKVFDNNIQRLRQIQRTLGASLFTSNFHPNVLRNAFQSADVVIGALHNDHPQHRYVIAEGLIETMKKGALIIDLRMNQGGCFETTCCLSAVDPEIFEQHGVLHFCKPFISNYVARTASMAFSNLLVPLLTEIGDMGSLKALIQYHPGVKQGIYLYSGKPVNDYISNHFNLRSNNIDIYLTAF